ncbi:MAG: serine/threonine protein kinase [Thermoguttaceae bacterium]|nr:serine/threonine protein kinase [Thermoguttaceae bacterium]MDW8078264.1 serine/threonine-protein kinase [Thermoguttaceae bacterium]
MHPERLGPYTIVRLIGRGGMGWVYEGVDSRTGEPAAIKVLAASVSREEGFRQRFEAEIEALRKLNHPNIVRLIGFGEEGDTLFYAMELVRGPSLEQELHQGRRFTPRETILIGLQVCGALRHAHDRGIIHRDIKPANLLRTPEGTVKLSDFGIARLFGVTGLTSAGNVLGTIEYMAPEQAEGKRVDHRCDLYSLGAVLYALLAGRPPYRARSALELLEKKRTEPPDPLRLYNGDVPRELEAVICQLLQRDPERRIGTAVALGRRLEELLRLVVDRESREAAATKVTPFDSSCFILTNRAPAEEDAPATEPLPTVAVLPASMAAGSASELPETKETSAFRIYKEAEEKPSLSAEAEAASPRQTGRFVVVPPEELGKTEEVAAEPSRPLISLQTWVLVLALVSVGTVVWYSLQPPTADQLYNRVIRQAEAGGVDALLVVEDDIAQFLLRFPDDPRVGKLQEFRNEIELYRLERQFERGLRGQMELGKLAPVERAYLEAIGLLRIDPDLAAEKLEALIALYSPSEGSANDPTGPAHQCVELARRRLARLREELDKAQGDLLQALESRLRQARALQETEPERALALCQAILTLYEGKRWAAQIVAEARALEAELRTSQRASSGPPPSNPPSTASPSVPKEN